MEHYIIAYDIKDDRRRTKIFKILKANATHVQFSIFEMYGTKESLMKLKYQIRKVMNTKEDSIFIYKQCQSCSKQIERIGVSVEIYGIGDVII